MRTLIQRILRCFSSFEKWELSSSDFYSIVRRVFERHTVSTFSQTFEKRGFRSTEVKPRSQLFSSMFSSLIQPRFDTYSFGLGQTEKSQTTPVHGRPKKRRTYWAAVARPTFSFSISEVFRLWARSRDRRVTHCTSDPTISSVSLHLMSKLIYKSEHWESSCFYTSVTAQMRRLKANSVDSVFKL